MRVHHLNCGTLCPLAARLVNGRGSAVRRGRLVCHCLLVEGARGLLLVDTGFGGSDCSGGEDLGRVFRWVAGPRLAPGETAATQIRALGFAPEDVRDIAVTHLDLDHAGGLSDFPAATVHVHAVEHDAAMCRRSLQDRFRYLPRHWAHAVRWERYGEDGEEWHGFHLAKPLAGWSEDVLLVPLAGHSRGHCGVAVRRATDWVLHCGDAYFSRREVDPERPSCPPGLVLFQALAGWNRQARLANLERVRAALRVPGANLVVACAHDPDEFERLRAGG